MGPPEGLWDKVRMLGKLKDWGEAMPQNVGQGPCQEIVVQGDELERRGLLDMMPVLTTWPGDGGPYITTPLVITRNPGERPAQHRHVPHAGLRRPHHRHALADPQDRRRPSRRVRKTQRTHAGLRGHRRSAGADLRGHGAAAAGHRRGHVRGLLDRRAGDHDQGRDLRSGGAGRGRLRHRRLRRAGRTPHGGRLRRPHRLVQPGRGIPGLPRDGDHQPPRSHLPDHHRRQAAHGGRLAGLGHRAPVPAAAEGAPARGGRLPPAGGGLLPQPGDHHASGSATPATRARCARRCGAPARSCSPRR